MTSSGFTQRIMGGLTPVCVCQRVEAGSSLFLEALGSGMRSEATAQAQAKMSDKFVLKCSFLRLLNSLGRKPKSKNFLSQTSAIPIWNPEDMWITRMCDIKSVHGPHFELKANLIFNAKICPKIEGFECFLPL